MFEFGSLTRVAVLCELALQLGALRSRALFGAVGAVDGALRTRFGLFGASLGGGGLLLGAFCVLAGALRVLLGRLAFELRVAGLLARDVALSRCLACARDRLLALLFGVLGSRDRVLRALCAFAGGGLGGDLRGDGRVRAGDCVLCCSFGVLRARLGVARACVCVAFASAVSLARWLASSAARIAVSAASSACIRSRLAAASCWAA